MSTTSAPAPERTAPADRLGTGATVLSWPGTRALIAVALLFLVSPLLAPESLGPTALVSMLPFAALIAVVAVGQTLVIQQGGLDLSVAGAVTLGAVIAAKLGTDGGLPLPVVLLVAVVATGAFGLLNGVVIAAFGLPPLVVTIAGNALMVGAVQAVSGGFSSQAPSALTTFALSRWFGLPVLLFVALGIVVVAHVVLKATRTGRRFELVGDNANAADYAGIRPQGYRIAAYAICSLLAGLTGVMLAGLLRIPTLTSGDAYLLPSIAAVVLGGTALTGGRGSVVGTALGALFLAQLTQLVQTFTQSTALQNIIQALIIGVGIIAQLQLGGSAARIKALFRPHHTTHRQHSTRSPL